MRYKSVSWDFISLLLNSMESLTAQLENLKFDPSIDVKLLKKQCLINIQKCYLSKNIFYKFSYKPGSNVLIKTKSGVTLCQIYPKMLLRGDIIEIDDSVKHFLVKEDFLHWEKIQLLNITEIKKSVVVKELRINLIYDSLKSIQLWNKQQDELAQILKKYLLKIFVFSNNCRIDLIDLPNRQKIGINKLEVNFPTESSEIIIGNINSKTKIIIDNQISQFQYDQMNEKMIKLFALDSPKKRLIEIIQLNYFFTKLDPQHHFPPTKQILLVGPTGCGKTSLVRYAAQKTECTLVTIFGHEVNRSEPGETESALRDLFEQAFQYAEISGKCIINLEEMDTLCPRRHGSAPHIQRAVSQLLLLLDKAQTIPGVIVIATTNKPDALEPSARRHGRLETEIYIAPPNEKQREMIIQCLLENIPQIIMVNETKLLLSQRIASMTPGYVGADLNLLFNTIKWKILSNKILCEGVEDTYKFWEDEFRKVILNMTPASLKGTIGVVTTCSSSLDDLGGLNEIKKTLEMATLWPIQHTEAFRRLGIPRPRGVLLFGPPGCAKTSLVRALASLGTFALLSISAAELYSPYVGDSERLISQLFQRARENSPCILFIDEIDALAGSRGEDKQINSEVQDRIIASLLTQMDGVGHRMVAADKIKDVSENDSENMDDGVIVIGATNRPDMVDTALMRPGRFDKHIFVPPPGIEARLDILKKYCSKMPIAQDVKLSEIALQTEFYSGADLKNICSEAAMIAMSDEGVDVTSITEKHFFKALNTCRPSLNKFQMGKFASFQKNKS